jgi:hypothetical protein
MKKIIFIITTAFLFSHSYAEDEYFYDMGNTVGYIKDNKGNKYIVVEQNDGAKLIKVKEDPKNLLKEKLGITKKDLKMGGNER